MTYGGGFVLLHLGFWAAPDTTMETWARKQAEKELVEEFGPDILKPPEWMKS